MMRTGLAAEFPTPEALLSAVRALRARGLRGLDAFTPHPVHGLEEALGLSRSPLNWWVFAVAMGAATTQTARGTVMTDADGPRRATLIIPSGQAATMDMLNLARLAGHHFTLISKPVHPTDLLSCISKLGVVAGAEN